MIRHFYIHKHSDHLPEVLPVSQANPETSSYLQLLEIQMGSGLLPGRLLWLGLSVHLPRAPGCVLPSQDTEMPITSFSGDQTAPNTPCMAAVEGVEGLHRLGDILDWDAAWECLGIGTLAEGGCKTMPKPTQSSGGTNNRCTRACKLHSL